MLGLDARRALIVVGCAYAIAQALLFEAARSPEFDESVYLTQVQRGIPAARFAEQRARGISFLVAPLALLGAPLVMISGLLIGASGSCWSLRSGRGRAGWSCRSAGSVLFAGSWLALYYGSEVMPNLHVAFGAVAAVGLVAFAMTQASRGVLPLIVGVTAWTALVRPTDATSLWSACL